MAFFDRVRFTVSGTPGTGAITVGSAVSGFKTPASAQPAAIPNGTALQLMAEDGVEWEIFDSVYTTSGTSLSRGTLRASSTGSQLSLSSAAIITVIVAARQIIDKTDFISITKSSGASAAHTGDTAEVTLATITVPALAANAQLDFMYFVTSVGTAGTKTFRIYFGATGSGTGGTKYHESAIPATSIQQKTWWSLLSLSTSSQIGGASGINGIGNSATAAVTSSVTTTGPTELTITVQNANSGDSSTLQGWLLEVLP